MKQGGLLKESRFEGTGIQPRLARLAKEGKIIHRRSSHNVLLRAEALTAGAGAGRVGIAYFETAVRQGIDEVQFAASHIKGALGVHHDADAGAFDENVAIGRLVLEIHFVLKTRTAAADDGDAQDASRPTLFVEQGTDFLGRRRGDFDKPFIPDPNLRGRGGIGGGRSCSDHGLTYPTRREQSMRSGWIYKWTQLTKRPRLLAG
jgi:hypothetical protein